MTGHGDQSILNDYFNMKTTFILLLISGFIFSMENDLNRVFGELIEKTPSQENQTLAILPLNVSATQTAKEVGKMVIKEQPLSQ